MADQIIASLLSTMSPDINVRQAAEAELQILEVTEDFCVHLSKITVDRNFDSGLRQLASLILKRYVDSHWSALSDKFSPPETNDTAKMAVRQMLPLGLSDPEHKIRTGIAYAISTIASWDWPEDWPGLFDCLMQGLSSGEQNSVHGAMRVLTEFIRDITDVHMLKVIPALLPEMYKILADGERYDIRIRSRAVNIFQNCAAFTVDVSNRKSELHVSLARFVPSFLENFIATLKRSDHSDEGLIKEIIRTIRILLQGFRKEFFPVIAEILPVIWGIFTKSSELYLKRQVMSSEGHDNIVDSDGEGVGFENVVYNTFDFIETMIEIKACRQIVERSLEDLFFHLIVYMQVTEEQISSWSEDPDQFVQDEDDETFSYSIRISALDLFLTCCKDYTQGGALPLFRAVERHVQLANDARNSNNPCWWKSYEALMLAIGSVERLISETIHAGNANFNVNIFVTTIVLPSLKASEFPFLVGRAIWVASRFAGMLEADMLTQFIEYTVQGLKDNQQPAVRISAVRAACNFCDHLHSANATDKLFPYCDNLLQGLVQLAMQASVETLALVLEALAIVIKVNESASANHESHITSMCLTVFSRHSLDPFIMSLCTDVFEIMAGFESCNQSLLDRTMPVLANILAHGPQDKGDGIGNIVGTTLELLSVIVRGTPAPFPDALMNSIFPATVQAVTTSDDSSIIMSGCDVVRAYISKSPGQILAWSDQEGVTGWQYVLRVASHILDPRISEHSAASVGRLVGVMIRHFSSQLTEVLNQLLRAVLSKLQQARTVTVIQSLLTIFAYLFKNDLRATCNFLSEVPGPKGNTAFEFVMSEWCEKQSLFYGHFDTKLCTLALADLFKHSMAANDERINKIMVKGEQIIDGTLRMKTRSRAIKEPDKWTTIPLPVKIFKLLVAELGHALDIDDAKIEDDNVDDDDTWDDDNGELCSKYTDNTGVSTFDVCYIT